MKRRWVEQYNSYVQDSRWGQMFRQCWEPSEAHLTGPGRRSTKMRGLRIKRILAFAGRTLAYPNASLNGAQGGAESLG
jgi:hypothetical protein